MNGEDNIQTEYVTVYEGGTLIYGTEPDGTKGKGSVSANPAPNGEPITTTPSQTTATTQPVSKIVYGDVNCDGYVRIDDVVLLNRFVAEDDAVTVSVQGIANAQCYADGEIDGKDATMLLQYLVGAISYDALGAPIQ